MRLLILLTLVVLASTAPKGAHKFQFLNLFKDPINAPRTKPQPHIVGGQEAEPHSIPYQAFLEVHTSTSGGYCGGSLISQNFVLTAGHCGDGVQLALVTLGAHRLSEVLPTEITIRSTVILVHPEYDKDLITNDVAVIQLPVPILLTDTISPVVLASGTDDYIGDAARVSGWGLTNGFNNVLSDALNYVVVTVISTKECEQDFESIAETTLCTSGNNKTGSCNGDSGGPLISNGTQIGIVSFGISACLPGYASAFARVTSFIGWIVENTDVTI